MSGSGKGGDNRGGRHRFSKRRDKENSQSSWQDSSRSPENSGRHSKKTSDPLRLGDAKFEKNRGSLYDRPRWTPPKLPEDPIPTPDCPWCGKPIKDISAAITDKNSGAPIHFDCVLARLGESETLEAGDTISYIGGGRFGIVHFNQAQGHSADNRHGRPSAQETRDFTIKKIFEWENKDDRAEWRRSIGDHFSIT